MTKNNALILLTVMLLAAVHAAAAELPANQRIDEAELKPVAIKILNPGGNPVAGASLEIIETGQRFISNKSGVVTMAYPAMERITLRAFTEEYSDIRKSFLRTELLASPITEIQFTEMRTFGETIVITGTREETLLRDVTVRTEVVTSQLIDNRQAFTLADAIDGLSGLRVENNCQNCGFNQLRINGLEGGYSRITIDGMSAYSSMSGVYGLEHLPSVIVDQVEVVKGGGSVLYGSGAVGGVVNVITKKPTTNMITLQSSLASMGGEPAGIGQATASWVDADMGTSFFVYASMNKSGEYDRNGDGFSDIGRKQMESGGIKFYQSLLQDSAMLNISADVAHEWRRGGSEIDKPHSEVLVSEFAETLRRTATLDWTHYLSGETHYQLQLSYAKNERDTYYGAYYDPNAFGVTDNPHSLANLTVFHDIANHSLSVGVQYEKDELDDLHEGYNFRTLQEYETTGVFIQDDIRVSDSLSILTGLRLDDHSALEDPVISPRLSLMWAVTDHIRVRASYAYGFKAPLVFDEDLHITIANGDPTFIVNAEGLLPESVHSYSASIEYSDSLKNGMTWRFETNAFYSDLENTFVTEDLHGEESNLFIRTNGGSSSSYGMEFTGELSAGSLTMIGSLTTQRTRLEEPEPDFGATRFFKAPDVYGNLNAIYTASRYSITASYTYTGSMLVPHYAGYIAEDVLEESEDFHVIDLRFEVPFTISERSISFIAMAGNITDAFQDDFDKGPDRDAGYVYGPRTPRTISAGFKVAF